MTLVKEYVVMVELVTDENGVEYAAREQWYDADTRKPDRRGGAAYIKRAGPDQVVEEYWMKDGEAHRPPIQGLAHSVWCEKTGAFIRGAYYENGIAQPQPSSILDPEVS